MREQACATASELVEEDAAVAVVLAQISLPYFQRALRDHADRVVNVGIMEQAMVGVAAGFALEGFHPIVHTIAPFLVERPLEQMKLDFGYQGLGGAFVSVGASYDYAPEGPTHHAAGDIAVLMTVPEFELLIPGHAAEVASLLRSTYANGRPTYMRTSVRTNRAPHDVVPGRMEVIRRGASATIVAIGPMLDPTIEAAAGLDVTILYMTSVEPFDHETLIRELTGTVIAVEPFLEGSVAPKLVKARAGRPVIIECIGVGPARLVGYGLPEQNDESAGIDVATLRARLRRCIVSATF